MQMSYQTDERFLGGLLTERVTELNTQYENLRRCPDEEVAETYGAIVESIVLISSPLPSWLRDAAVTEEHRILDFERVRYMEVDSPERDLVRLFEELHQLRSYLLNPFSKADNPAENRRLVEMFLKEPVKELLSWCSASAEVPTENLQTNSGSVCIYDNGQFFCSRAKRCYCEGDRYGNCIGL